LPQRGNYFTHDEKYSQLFAAAAESAPDGTKYREASERGIQKGEGPECQDHLTEEDLRSTD